MIAEDRLQATAFLETNILRHLVHLKFLHLYPNDVDCFYYEDEGTTGVLLSHATTLTPKDRDNYPDQEHILLPTASSQSSADILLRHVLTQFSHSPQVVIKFCDPLTREVFRSKFHLEFVRSVISFTTDQFEDMPLDQNVVISDQLDDACANLYMQNGYTRADLEHYFADHALSFTIYEVGQPVCTCLAFHNFGNVWEIGALRTVETAQRKGYARRVVSAAVGTILRNGWIPRYQTEDTNTASLTLAEKLGLRVCLRFEHYLATPNRSV